jgi:hypothetical protein
MTYDLGIRGDLLVCGYKTFGISHKQDLSDFISIFEPGPWGQVRDIGLCLKKHQAGKCLKFEMS